MPKESYRCSSNSKALQIPIIPKSINKTTLKAHNSNSNLTIIGFIMEAVITTTTGMITKITEKAETPIIIITIITITTIRMEMINITIREADRIKIDMVVVVVVEEGETTAITAMIIIEAIHSEEATEEVIEEVIRRIMIGKTHKAIEGKAEMALMIGIITILKAKGRKAVLVEIAIR